MWRSLTNRLRGPRPSGSRPVPTHINRTSRDLRVTCFVFEQLSLEAFVAQMDLFRAETAAFGEILQLYRVKRSFPDLSNFRLGPNMFDKILLDWILLVDDSKGEERSRLLAHGVATRIRWSGDVADLPSGWQGAVRQSYLDNIVNGATCNSLVGLFINVEPPFREGGLAADVVGTMKTIRREQRLAHFIIPLRLPQHYTRENAALPIAQFSAMRRTDGLPLDHWLRLHVRLGAQIAATSETSHQHAMSTRDFFGQFGARFETSGYHLVEKNGEWFRAYLDVERDFALVNQGCVWVQYPPN